MRCATELPRGVLLILLALAPLLATGPHCDAGSITFTGTAKGTAASGTFDGKTPDKDQLADAMDHAKLYDGDVQFKADYTIVLKADKTLDTSKSFVTFITQSYTDEGTKVKSDFKTDKIQITDVTLKDNDPTMPLTMKFNSTQWYPESAPLGKELNNLGLSGMFDFTTGKSSYTASYQDKSNGAVYTYMVTGMKLNAPIPPPLPPNFGPDPFFSPFGASVPEATTWVMALPAFACILLCRLGIAARK